MTDIKHGIEQPEERSPKRVIGTPSPAASTSLLGTEAPAGGGTRQVPGVIPQDEKTAKKGERITALCFIVAFLAGIAFVVSYVVFQVGDINSTATSNFALGSSLAVALLALASGMVTWVRMVMPKYNLVQERHPMVSGGEARAYVGETFLQGAEESGLTKRPLLRRTLLAAAAPLGLAPLVLLRDLGPAYKDFPAKLRHTVWGEKTKEGKPRKLVIEGTGDPIRAADFNSPGGILSVVPEGYEHDLNALAKATLILIKLRPDEIKSGTNLNWTHDGIIAYSKICTHVGCPAALYEQSTHHILCPCHQSTFDAADGAKVVFGPAARPLPQLPIGVDEEGYLVATGDFAVPVGPSFWERGDAEAEVRENGGHA
ncbi:ubiquinol-cytochrome c reductase iron-sulfur subunit [Streptosporangium becharense]|uniref:Cytochrome bc1 complex Rieske iron-sulfur subunit n=1 Tax=Streptosporangium becharense TaxID=1816182 RepID=A0A7W9MEX7_9ACTN|nr:Rieske 2Fe-2S domain-containing protein [Streptosporangium becharense]MBB2911895.1 ubiquinol-cytochrome c reductase iron-sulfur subunit [Streptosporangium becharense]MBB5818442.1 ubiquinol-cytochrome c reductase iron-sulfur subunit [Streptosporangium becharense]